MHRIPKQTNRWSKGVNNITKKLVILFILSISFSIFAQLDYTDSNLVMELDNPPDIAAPDKSLNITLLDRANNPIEGAYVEIDNGAPMGATSDAFGNVTFTNIDNDDYDITVTYDLGDKNVEYTINESIYTLNIGAGQFTSHIVYCNLTTVDLEVGDNNLNKDVWGLWNANITLQDPNTGENITSYYTDFDGLVTLKLPATEWDMNIQYQGISRSFFIFVVGGDNDPAYVQNLTINPGVSSYDYDVHVILNEISTQLNIREYEFKESGWTHQTDLTKPYDTGMYYEDLMKLKLQWNDTRNEIGINKPSGGVIWNHWTIQREFSTINSSDSAPDALKPISCEDGNYTFVIDSTDYYAGSYTLTLTCNKTGYQDAMIVLDFDIWNHTTSLTINYTSAIHINYSQSLYLEADYRTVLPYEQNIDDTEADLFYKVIGEGISGQLTYNAGTGNFTMNDVAINLPVGTYDLQIYGNGTNFQWVANPYILVVDPIETDVAFLIDDDYRISSTFLKAAHGENVSFMINFTNIDGDVLASSSLNIYIDENPISSAYYSLIDSGPYTNLWNVSFAANLYSPSSYTLKAQLTKPNHEENNATLFVTIVEYWDSRIDLIEAPGEPNWADNVSIQIRYRCIEDPSPTSRINLPIEGATISELQVTIKRSLEHITQLTLGPTDISKGKWGWNENETAGHYDIWLSTQYLNITEETKLFIIPVIQEGVYDEANSTNIYFDLDTLDTSLQCFNNSNPTSPLAYFEINAGYNEYVDVRMQLNVSESSSHLDKLPLDGANVQYWIKNKSNSEIVIGPSSATPIGDGKYTYRLNSTDDLLGPGSFRFYVNASLENHTHSEAQFDFNITDIVEYEIVIPSIFRESATKLKAAMNENFTFYIDLEGTTVGADVSVYLDGSPTPVDWAYSLNPAENNGYDVNCTELGSVIGEGVHSIRVYVSTDKYIFLEKSLQLEIIDTWTTYIEIESPPATTYWGHNQSFILHYYCSEDPRDGFDISDAMIQALAVGNETDGSNFITLNETSYPGYWGYKNLNETVGYGDGYYLVWFNTSIFPYVNETVVIAYPYLNGSVLYQPRGFQVPMTIIPVQTDLQYQADPTATHTFDSNFNLLTLMTGENTNIYFNYSVMDVENKYNGQSLNLTQTNVHFTVRNRSNSNNICWEDDLVFDEGNTETWNWSVSDSDLSQHEFSVTVTFSCLNYTQQIASFRIVIGQSETTFRYAIPDDLKGNPNNNNSIIVSQGENFSITVTFPNLNVKGDGWVQVYIGSTLLPEEHGYWISNNQINYTTPITGSIAGGTYDCMVQTNQIGYIPSNKTFSTRVYEFWPATLHVVEPPWRYPWGNIVQLNTSYYCTEYPRNDTLLTGATISQIKIVLTSEETSITKGIYDADDIAAGIWGYEEMFATKGAGYYSIWFNSSYVDLDFEDVQSYYIIPTIQVGIYNESQAKPKPNYSVYPVPTAMTISQTSSISNLDLDNMYVYLDDDLSINVRYFGYDEEELSLFHNLGIDGVTLTYEVYNKSDGSSLLWSGTLTGSGNGIYPWNLPTHIIGNYTILLNATKGNFLTQTMSFNLFVQRYDVDHNFNGVEGGAQILETPQNEGINVSFKLMDPHFDTVLSGATVTFVFNGIPLECNEISPGSGIYTAFIPDSELRKLRVGDSYPAYIQVSKTNYTDYSFTIQVRVDLPVDPYFGVPYAYWIVIGVSIIAFISALVVRQTILKARVPTVIKQINSATKIIKKGKDAPGKRFALTYTEEMYKRYRSDWKALGLDMADAIDIDTKELARMDEDLKEMLEDTAREGEGELQSGEDAKSKIDDIETEEDSDNSEISKKKQANKAKSKTKKKKKEKPEKKKTKKDEEKAEEES